jgi:hypothetical protein
MLLLALGEYVHDESGARLKVTNPLGPSGAQAPNAPLNKSANRHDKKSDSPRRMATSG